MFEDWDLVHEQKIDGISVKGFRISPMSLFQVLGFRKCLPLEELREVCSNFEYLLKIEKTSKEEMAETSEEAKIPPETLKISKQLSESLTP